MSLNNIKINNTTNVNTGVVYDISKATNQTYDTLADALGTDGNNVPSEVREGGMSVRFVSNSDNKYVQYRLMSDSFNTTEANWQGVDDEPTAGSNNLVKSGGVAYNTGLLNAHFGVNCFVTKSITESTFRIDILQPLLKGIEAFIKITGDSGIVQNDILNLRLYDKEGNIIHSGNIYIGGATRKITPSEDVYRIFFERASTIGSGNVNITIFAHADSNNGSVMYNQEQLLNDEEKTQARKNIDVPLKSDLDLLNDVVNGSVNKTEITGITWVDGYYSGGSIVQKGSGFASGPVDVSSYKGKKIRVTRNNNTVTARYSYYVDTNNLVQYLGSEGLYSTPDGNGNFYGDVFVPADAVTFYISLNPNCTTHKIEVLTEETGLVQRDKVIYVSTSGNDLNDGSSTLPKKTITNALQHGNIIILDEGTYNESVELDGVLYNTVIIKAIPTKKVIIKLDADILVNNSSETLVDGYTKVYQKALPNNPFSGKTTGRIYQENVMDINTLINDLDRHPLQRGRQYRCDTTCIKQCSSIAAIEALPENQYGFYWENGVMYFSRPSNTSGTKPVVIPKFGNCFLHSTKDIAIRLENIEIRYGNISIENSAKVECINISMMYANVSVNGGFAFKDCTNVYLERCEASSITDGGITGDGFNFHTTNANGAEPFYLTAQLVDCWAHDVNDDGCSDHEYSEVTIDGGLFEFNGKGGVTPSYGANDVLRNVTCRYNIDESKATGNGIYVTGNPSYSRNNTCVIADSCVCYGNHFGFRAAQSECVLICRNCISYGNDWGNWRAGDGEGRIICVNCKSGDGSSTTSGNITTITLD